LAATRPTDSLQSKKGCGRRALRRGDCRSGAGKLRPSQRRCFPHIRSAILKKSQARKTNANSQKSPIKTPSFLLLQNAYHSGGNMTSNTKMAGRPVASRTTPPKAPSARKSSSSMKTSIMRAGLSSSCLGGDRSRRNPHLQPKTAFSRFPPVHRAGSGGQRRVETGGFAKVIELRGIARISPFLAFANPYFRPSDMKT
jgi:hypothetical protein